MARGEPNDGDWVEKLVGLAEAVGLSGVRVRWRLERLRLQWQRTVRSAENDTRHLSYEHTVCPACGRVQDRSNRACDKCGVALGPRPLQLARRVGLVVPNLLSVSTVLGFVMLGAYLRIMIAQPGSGYLSVEGGLLVRHGAYWLPAIEAGQWWRHATAVFLHIGLWHLGFNLVALAQVGPAIEELFGRGRMAMIFMLAGVLANVGCQLWGLHAISAGASGALMGLIGAAAGWGHRDGTSLGKDMRNRMLKWGAYTMVFGLLVNANHVAHAVGFAVGALLGLVTPPTWRRGDVPRAADLAMLTLGLGTALAAGVLIVRPPAAAVEHATLLSRELGSQVDRAERAERQVRALREACALEIGGKVAEARARFPEAYAMAEAFEHADGGSAGPCDEVASIARYCSERAGRRSPLPDPTEDLRLEQQQDSELLARVCAATGEPLSPAAAPSGSSREPTRDGAQGDAVAR